MLNSLFFVKEEELYNIHIENILLFTHGNILLNYYSM